MGGQSYRRCRDVSLFGFKVHNQANTWNIIDSSYLRRILQYYGFKPGPMETGVIC
jgi:hypothetical protein